MLRHSFKIALLGVALTLGASSAYPAGSKSIRVFSPDKKLSLNFGISEAGAPFYSLDSSGQQVLQQSKLGLIRDDADFSQRLKVLSISGTQSVRDKYEILTAKRRVNTYLANRRVVHLQAASGQKLDIIFQVSNDGAAFRYFFPEKSATLRKLVEEKSSFHMMPGTRAWMQPMSPAKSGWEQTNPAYEEFYEKDISTGTPSPTGAGWVYPALFRSGDKWLLLSEGTLSRNYCATRLRTEAPDGEYGVGFPDPREVLPGGSANPESQLPWLTPWRIIVVGSLKTITESTLGIDLATPATSPLAGIEPGKASWSWPLMGDSSANYETQKRFIDYAADMKWRYCLIDALWDMQIGDAKLKELVDYGKTKGVKILVWYNSNGSWNGAPQTPRNVLLTHEGRIREFERMKAIGIAGLKIDFFGGDGQSMIGYYIDILEDAAPYGFLINFHGTTLPRGLQRTYPHLMTAEAIRGLEYMTFFQATADQEPSHAAMLPFTRNVFDPMDFTPMVLDKLPSTKRVTTSAFELALSVLFTSGIQHYGEIPEGMAKTPDYVRDFLREVPSVWDDTKFIDGYPGKFVVLARRAGKRWYITGINGESTSKKLRLDLSSLGADGVATLIDDGDGPNLSFKKESVKIEAGKTLPVAMSPNGGFVIVLN